MWLHAVPVLVVLVAVQVCEQLLVLVDRQHTPPQLFH